MDCYQCEGCGACDKGEADEGVNYQGFWNMDDMLANDGHVEDEDKD